MPSLDEFARQKLGALDEAHLRRRLVPTARHGDLWVERNGRRLLSFSCNDYLGLSQHPALEAAAIAAIERHGVGAGASRLVTGDHPLYTELESRLARFKGTEAACVFGSGYLANAGIAPALVGRGDLILLDALSHSSLWTGARLSRAEMLSFRHNDTGHAAELLNQHRAQHKRALLLTEGVFSMDGDRSPLAELASLAREFDAWLMVDEAHITTFAVHPGWRRQRIGERLLLAFLDVAVDQGAHEATLEVRLSNLAARRLYEKFGFRPVGLRPRYYSDDHEDALIMTTLPLDESQMRERIARRRAELEAAPAPSAPDDDPDPGPDADSS